MKKLLILSALVGLLGGGVAGAVALTTGTVSVCSSTHTVAVDGVAVKTIAAQCVTTTYNVPTVTTTVTGPTTTVTSTQTVTVTNTTTTTPAPSGGGAKLAALYQIEDAASSATKVAVTTPSQLAAQAASPTASEVDVAAGTYPGQIEFSAKPTSVVKYVFAAGVKFTGGAIGTNTYVAMHVTGKNLVLWGPADVSNPGWDGIRVEGANSVVIGGGIKTHDNGNQGFLIQAASSNVWVDGLESTNNGTPAAAAADTVGSYYKSGVHGIYWGNGTVGGGIVNSYIHDQPNGHGIQVYDNSNTSQGSIFAFNTITRVSGAGDGSHQPGCGIYFYSGGSNQTVIGNVSTGNYYCGLSSHNTAGTASGQVFWANGTSDVSQEDSAPYLAVSDSHHVDPTLSTTDRPLASSPVKNIDSAYAANYLPRTDFTGSARVTADAGAFNAPSPAGGYGIIAEGDTLSNYSAAHQQGAAFVTVSAGSDATAAAALPGKSLVYMDADLIRQDGGSGVPYSEASTNGYLEPAGDPNYPGTAYAKIDAAGYATWFANKAVALAKQYGVDGIWLDDASASGNPYYTPTTQKPTIKAIVQALGSALHANGLYLMASANGYESGNAGSDDGSLHLAWWESLAPSVDGIATEYWQELPSDEITMRSRGANWNQHWDDWQAAAKQFHTDYPGKDFEGLTFGPVSNHVYGRASLALANPAGVFVGNQGATDMVASSWATCPKPVVDPVAVTASCQ